ncbi:MAG TPA: DUF397 domain-containing protein [Pseudonocardiaceae bacterium]|jgi:hypothetical protein|nr:DUF397 domain-containing protein [Pseudonocardiaceae bacterium]
MNNTRVAPPAALADATYTTSTRSTGTGNCVAVGRAGEWVGVQDTKQGPDSTRRTTVALPAASFCAFLDAVKAGTLR